MNLLASDVVTVECSCTAAFQYAANLENFGDWFPGVIDVAAEDSLPFDTSGKRYLETVAVPLKANRMVPIRVIDVMAPRWLVTEGELPVLLPRMEMEFHDGGLNACEVRWRMLSRNENALARYAVLPFAAWLMRRRAKTGLLTLKRLLESSGQKPKRDSIQPRAK